MNPGELLPGFAMDSFFISPEAESIVRASQTEAADRARRHAVLTALANEALGAADLPTFRARGLAAIKQVLTDHPCLADVSDIEVAADLIRSTLQLGDDERAFAVSALTFVGLVSQRWEAEAALKRQALYDPLTGLPNRSLLDDRLLRALARLDRSRKLIAVLFIDLDRFKVINDSLGHVFGDEVLRAVARRLQTAVRDGDTLARFGGDEFVVVCDDLATEWDANAVSARIVEAMSTPVEVAGRSIDTSLSIGVAFGRNAATPPEDLLRDADAAMYRAKERGRNRIEVFDDCMRYRAMQRLELEQALRRAIEDRLLDVHFQPVIDFSTGRVVSVEALVRWTDPEHGSVAPMDFVQLAEESGLIGDLTRLVLDRACSQLAAWRRIPGLGALTVAVNLSGRDLSSPDIAAVVTEALRVSGLPANALTIEITETALVDDETAAGTALSELRRAGVRIALDDFGTGYSSLAYLRRFPVDCVKLDRLFVAGIGNEADDEAIVRGVLALASSLGLSTVAEGVEDPCQAQMLRGLGCTYGQGYLYCRPLPAEVLTKALSRGCDWAPLASLGAPAAEDRPRQKDGTTKPHRVFLVDDSPTDRELTRTLLEESGKFVVVGEAESGSEALALTAETNPHLIVVDMNMPGMNGVELVARLTATLNARIVVLSGYVSPSVSHAVREAGAVACLEKGVDVMHLLDELSAAVSGSEVLL